MLPEMLGIFFYSWYLDLHYKFIFCLIKYKYIFWYVIIIIIIIIIIITGNSPNRSLHIEAIFYNGFFVRYFYMCLFVML